MDGYLFNKRKIDKILCQEDKICNCHDKNATFSADFELKDSREESINKIDIETLDLDESMNKRTFLQKAVQKRRFILEIFPSSSPLIFRSFESATNKFFEKQLLGIAKRESQRNSCCSTKTEYEKSYAKFSGDQKMWMMVNDAC